MPFGFVTRDGGFAKGRLKFDIEEPRINTAASRRAQQLDIADRRSGSECGFAASSTNLCDFDNHSERVEAKVGYNQALNPVIIETISFLCALAVKRSPICLPRLSTQMRSDSRNT